MYTEMLAVSPSKTDAGGFSSTCMVSFDGSTKSIEEAGLLDDALSESTRLTLK